MRAVQNEEHDEHDDRGKRHDDARCGLSLLSDALVEHVRVKGLRVGRARPGIALRAVRHRGGARGERRFGRGASHLRVSVSCSMVLEAFACIARGNVAACDQRKAARFGVFPRGLFFIASVVGGDVGARYAHRSVNDKP